MCKYYENIVWTFRREKVVLGQCVLYTACTVYTYIQYVHAGACMPFFVSLVFWNHVHQQHKKMSKFPAMGWISGVLAAIMAETAEPGSSLSSF